LISALFTLAYPRKNDVPAIETRPLRTAFWAFMKGIREALPTLFAMLQTGEPVYFTVLLQSTSTFGSA
jgi:hypothetical protein